MNKLTAQEIVVLNELMNRAIKGKQVVVPLAKAESFDSDYGIVLWASSVNEDGKVELEVDC